MNQKILYLIPARGGSKGIPKKNIKLLNGKPLIQYSIDAAKAISDTTHICLSTDDLEIAEIGKSLGLNIPFIRPQEISNDTASTISVIHHALKFYKDKGINYNLVVVIQPTSPMRKSEHISEAIGMFESGKDDLVISVKETDANPYYLLYEEDGDYLQKSKKLSSDIIRRQDAPIVYQLNGAIYVYDAKKVLSVNSLDELTNKKKYVMSKVDSIDLDDMIDWEFCDFLIKKAM
jgi:CMP-N,N'-diacetyllegionaminic acid synthase